MTDYLSSIWNLKCSLKLVELIQVTNYLDFYDAQMLPHEVKTGNKITPKLSFIIFRNIFVEWYILSASSYTINTS